MRHLDRVTCAQILDRLDDYIDRELGPDEVRRVEAHLRDCATCAAECLFETTVLVQIRSKLRQLDVPETLRDRILARLPAAPDSGI
jgi:anti-sigma factor (TIGR02949 family)